jgi:hypothetical protein
VRLCLGLFARGRTATAAGESKNLRECGGGIEEIDTAAASTAVLLHCYTRKLNFSGRRKRTIELEPLLDIYWLCLLLRATRKRQHSLTLRDHYFPSRRLKRRINCLWNRVLNKLKIICARNPLGRYRARGICQYVRLQSTHFRY